jgi:hypothetical protein
MDTVVSFLDDWKDLIITIFGEYPLAAAIGTLFSLVYFYARRNGFAFRWRFRNLEEVIGEFREALNGGPAIKDWRESALWTLLLWCVVVPLLGVVFMIVGAVLSLVLKLFGIGEGVLAAGGSVVAGLYTLYKSHYLVFLVMVLLAVIAYLTWKRFKPHVLPNKYVRVVVVLAVFIMVAYIAAPIADHLLPNKDEVTTVDPTKGN